MLFVWRADIQTNPIYTSDAGATGVAMELNRAYVETLIRTLLEGTVQLAQRSSVSSVVQTNLEALMAVFTENERLMFDNEKEALVAFRDFVNTPLRGGGGGSGGGN